uniref:ATP synthase complex subunit 8 n=1 Tax=Coccidula rufa TaxID=115345 RepID=A0A0S2MPE4_9CUCU|nr:ATP synthase F0 subunit 8 [Coccidula rufa]
MPQMMPLNWMMLFLYFIMLFMILNILLYFNFQPIPNMKNLKFKKIINWKW